MELKEILKEAVLRYVDVLREEKEKAAALSRKRSEKKVLREEITKLMRQSNLQDAKLEDTGTLVSRRPKRRLQALKRSAVEAWAAELIGDQEKTVEEVGRLYEGRDVTFTEELTVTEA